MTFYRIISAAPAPVFGDNCQKQAVFVLRRHGWNVSGGPVPWRPRFSHRRLVSWKMSLGEGVPSAQPFESFPGRLAPGVAGNHIAVAPSALGAGPLRWVLLRRPSAGPCRCGRCVRRSCRPGPRPWLRPSPGWPGPRRSGRTPRPPARPRPAESRAGRGRMARGNFESESSHFRRVCQLRCLGLRFALWLGEGGQVARMGTFDVKVPI